MNRRRKIIPAMIKLRIKYHLEFRILKKYFFHTSGILKNMNPFLTQVYTVFFKAVWGDIHQSILYPVTY